MRRVVFALGCLLTTALCAQSQTALLARPLAEIARPQRFEIAASVVSPNDSLLAAEVTAVIAAIDVDVGQTVEAGQRLLQLDPRDAELAVKQTRARRQAAAAQLTLAQQRLQRGKELGQRDFLSSDELLALQTTLDAAKAELAVAEASLAITQRQLDKTAVRAPFAGVVMERHAQQGALAIPGTPLLRLTDLSAPEVDAALPAEVASVLDDGHQAEFVTGGRTWPLRLLRRSPVLSPASRTYPTRFEFVAAAAPAGSSGQLRLTGSGQRLPADYLVSRDGQLGVFIAESGQARFVPLPEARGGRDARIDLAADTLIVVQGHKAAEDGRTVTVDGR